MDASRSGGSYLRPREQIETPPGARDVPRSKKTCITIMFVISFQEQMRISREILRSCDGRPSASAFGIRNATPELSRSRQESFSDAADIRIALIEAILSSRGGVSARRLCRAILLLFRLDDFLKIINLNAPGQAVNEIRGSHRGGHGHRLTVRFAGHRQKSFRLR